jgi:hypothetical protein
MSFGSRCAVPRKTIRTSPRSASTANYTWAEVYLEAVNESAEGPRRVEDARAVVRMWFDGTHFDVPYADVAATLDRARTLLLVGESHVAPE